jgi:hypothetical protein
MKKIVIAAAIFFISNHIIYPGDVEASKVVVKKPERQELCNSIFREIVKFLPRANNGWADDSANRFEALVLAYEHLKCIEFEQE